MQTRNRAVATTARWLRRRQNEGVIDADAASSGGEGSTIVSASLVAASSSPLSPFQRHIPAAIIESSNEHTGRSNNSSDSFFNKRKIIESCLPRLRQQRSATEFATSMNKYLTLTARLALEDSSSSCWLDAISLFQDATGEISARPATDPVLRAALESSSKWGPTWVDLASSSSSSSSSSKQQHQSASSSFSASTSLSSLHARAAVSSSLLPLARRPVEQMIQERVLQPVQKVLDSREAASRSFTAALEKKLGEGDNARVVRDFLAAAFSERVSASKRLVGEEVASQAVSRLLQQHLADEFGVESVVGISELVGQLVAPKDHNSATAALVTTRFERWCSVSALPRLIVASLIIGNAARSEVVDGALLFDSLQKFLRQFSAPTLRRNHAASSSLSSSFTPLVSPARATLLQFVTKHLTPFGGARVSSPLLPVLSCVCALLGETDAQQQSTSTAWNAVAWILAGNFAEIPSLRLRELVAKMKSESSSSSTTANVLPILKVCVAALAFKCGCGDADAEVVSSVLSASSSASSSAGVSAHFTSFLVSRARAVSELLPTPPSPTESILITQRVLGFPLLMSRLVLEHEAPATPSQLRWLLGSHSQDSSRALASLMSRRPSVWQEASIVVEQRNLAAAGATPDAATTSLRRSLAAALVQNAMWREALAVADVADVHRISHGLLPRENDGEDGAGRDSNGFSSSWQLAVSLLTEVSRRNIKPRPALLVSLLRVLNADSTPQDVSVDMTIQLSAPAAATSTPSSSSSSPTNPDGVVNLLVSVTRAVVRQQQQQTWSSSSSKTDDDEDSTETDFSIPGASAASRARVFALSSLLSSSPSSASSNQQHDHHSHPPGGINRRVAGSLRAAMILCADTGDWASALYLISTVAQQAPSFTLAPDVVWKVARALEQAGQEQRVDALRGYVASQDVSRWLSADADANLAQTFPAEWAAASDGRGTTVRHDEGNGGGDNKSNHHHGDDDAHQLFDGIHRAEYVRLRCGAIHKVAAIGRWRTAALILSDMHSRLRVSGGVAAGQQQDGNSNNSLHHSEDQLVSRACAATVFVCATRLHWQQALAAFAIYKRLSQSHPKQRSSAMPLPTIVALIRSLARQGRWQDATLVFSTLPLAGKAASSSSVATTTTTRKRQQQEQQRQRVASTIFSTLIRSCRVSRSWLAALQLHNSRPDLVTFASVSEVVAVCSASGFPLTKIQLWLNVAQSSLFLVATSSGSSSSSSSSSNMLSSTNEDEQQSSASTSSIAALTALDVTVFFALLNAQSHAVADEAGLSSNQQQQQSDAGGGTRSAAWYRALQLLNSCWTSSSSSSNSSNELTSRQPTAAAFDAARAPDCVASVIDTCLRQGQWRAAFSVYNVQRLMLVPSTAHSVFLLLTAIKENMSSTGATTSSVFSWLNALRLVSDAVHRSSSSSSSSSARPSRVLQPLVCERLVQVLCRGGQWQRALEFAWLAGPSMGNLMTNDRVLDSFVRDAAGRNPLVVVRAALASGSFPVSAKHSLGEKVVEAADELLSFGEDSTAWQLALTALGGKAIAATSRDVPAAVVARARLAALRRSGDCCGGGATKSEITMWIELAAAPAAAESSFNEEQQHQQLSGPLACDLSFAHFSLCCMAHSRRGTFFADHLKKAESLLRFSLLFGVPDSRSVVEVEWPQRLEALSPPAWAMEEIVATLKMIAEEIP